MSVDDIVQLTIVVSDASLSRPGFGTPLALLSSVPAGWGANKVREFSKLSELTDLGFTTTSTGYKIASKIKSQKPAPSKFKMAKRATVPAQSLALKCLSAVEGDVYSIEVGVDGGTTTTLSYTVLAAATTATVATAIELLIEAVVGVNSTSAANVITVTPAVAGTLVNLKSWNKHFSVQDMTADPGVSADLDAAYTEDSDWYGVLIDSNSESEIKGAAGWTEANGKLFAYSTSDTDCKNPAVTTDVASDLKLLAYDRTFGIYNGNETLSCAAAAWMARGFVFDPGAITWAFKDLKGVASDKLTSGEQNALEAKNLNFYVTKFGKPITYDGKLASGEFIDVTHGLDWLDAEMKLQVFATVSGLPKLPYTIHGLGAIEATVRAVLRAGVKQKLLADDDNLTVTMPTLDEIDPVTKAQRLVPSIEFSATLAGAIHRTKLNGSISH